MISPMLCHTATIGQVPGDWMMEPKLDGWRWQIERTEHGIREGAGRTGNGTYACPPVAEAALLSLPIGTVLDGELLPTETGHQSTKVPTLLARGGHGLMFVAFDVMRVAGVDATSYPYTERRKVLEKLAENFDNDVMMLGVAVPVDAERLDLWLGLGMEGAVCKAPTSTYRPGARTREWLKVKPQTTDDATVIGFEEGGGKFAGQIGALRLRMIDTGVETTASGMTDDVRLDMTLNPDRWMGRRVEIAHHGLHPVSKVPRHPQYKRLREDLEGPTTTTEEGTMPRVRKQFVGLSDGSTDERGKRPDPKPRQKQREVQPGAWIRNYGAMGAAKLLRCIDELTRGSGDAVDRVKGKDGSLARNLEAAVEAARQKGLR